VKRGFKLGGWPFSSTRDNQPQQEGALCEGPHLLTMRGATLLLTPCREKIFYFTYLNHVFSNIIVL